MPCLQLVIPHRSANLPENVIKTYLNKSSLRKIYARSDSTTVLYWLKGNEVLKTFISNRVSKIKGTSFIEWKQFLRRKIQSILAVDVAKYVSLIIKNEKDPNGSKIKHNGLNNQKLNIARNLKQKKKIKEILATALTTKKNMFHELLSKSSLLKIFKVH